LDKSSEGEIENVRMEEMRAPFLARHEGAIIEIKILSVVAAIFAGAIYGDRIVAFLSRLF
jgi:hypothetical protein